VNQVRAPGHDTHEPHTCEVRVPVGVRERQQVRMGGGGPGKTGGALKTLDVTPRVRCSLRPAPPTSSASPEALRDGP
jgi:hypothetical protein